LQQPLGLRRQRRSVRIHIIVGCLLFYIVLGEPRCEGCLLLGLGEPGI
jgi:hypothetical protein